MAISQDQTQWQALWDGPDTVKTQTRILEGFKTRSCIPDADRPQRITAAEAYLAALMAGKPSTLTPLQIARQRVYRLKEYNAPQSWVKRAVTDANAIEKQELEAKLLEHVANEAKWSELWNGPDTVETMTKVLEFLNKSPYRPHAQTCLADLVNGCALNLTPLENADHRIWRLKAYDAPQAMVNRAVEERAAVEETWWTALLQGPDTPRTQARVVQWLKEYLESDYFQAEDYFLHLATERPWAMSKEEQAAQAVRRLKAHDAPQKYIDEATNAFLKLKFH
jgi:hypothetical protein